jgi:cysteine synthase A
MSAGTGGTSATLGRYIRYQGFDTYLLVVDPQHSVFFDYWHSRDTRLRSTRGSMIEGIGRPRVEPSFMPDVIDEIMKVPDGATIAAMLKLEKLLGRKPGASTGTNFWGMIQVAKRMRENNEKGALVTLLCDSGERYLDSYYQPEWVAKNIGDIQPWLRELE